MTWLKEDHHDSIGPAASVRRACPAKVNLSLHVGAPDATGMHPLASWMVAIRFADTLWLRKSTGLESRFHIRAAAPNAPVHEIATPPGDTWPPVLIDWPIEQDLTHRAHALLESHTGRRLPILLELDKRIPPGAGLGGGSSNAAALLAGLNELFDLRLGDSALASIGRQLGSDVPFLLQALSSHRSALVMGVGERIEPLPLDGVIHLVLIFPEFGCPTGRVYAAFDRLHHDRPFPKIDPQSLRTLARRQPLPTDRLRNDLTDAAYDVRPELKTLANDLGQRLRTPIHVTGSGSTLYLVAATSTACRQLARQAADITGLPTVATETLPATQAQRPPDHPGTAEPTP